MIVDIDRVSQISHYQIGGVSVDTFPKTRLETCPVCGGRNTDTLYSVDFSGHAGFGEQVGLNKLLCDYCGHLFFDRCPSYSQLEAFYASSWHSAINIDPDLVKLSPNYANWASIHFLKALRIEKSAKILDFGCGYGDAIKTLECEGFSKVYGVEIGEARFKVARSHFGESVLHGSTEVLPSMIESTGIFDVIFSNHVFEHLSDPLNVLENLKRCLAEDGVIAIGVPAPGSESAVHSAIYYPHLHGYSENSLAILFEKIGFRSRVWRGSKTQLCVVGARDDSRLDVPGFASTDDGSVSTRRIHFDVHNDLRNVLGGSVSANNKGSRKKWLSFSHAWTLGGKVGPSGTRVESGPSKLVIQLFDLLAAASGRLLPLKYHEKLKSLLRSLFYRVVVKLTSAGTVDALLCSVRDDGQPGIRFRFLRSPGVLDK